ncbi:MAG: TraR/DksA family transcriptional regulator [Candidatus Firestonebacteria bacterium]
MKKTKNKAALKPKKGKIVKIKKAVKVKKIAAVKPVKLPARDLKKYKRLLLSQKKEFIEELNKNLDDSKKIDFNEVKDSVDLASDTYDTEFLHNLSDAEKRQIEEIDCALEKIALKTFGTCESCNKKINKNRLSVLPQAKLCFTCQTNKGG